MDLRFQKIQHFLGNLLFIQNACPLEFSGQKGHSGISKSGGIGLWLYASIFHKTKNM